MKDYRLALRLPRLLLHRRTILVAAGVLFIAALEYLGRQTTSDIGDAGCLAAVVLFGLTAWTVWRGSLTASHINHQLKQLLDFLKDRFPKRGYDLRDSPPLPRGLPRAAIMWTAVTVAVAVAAFFAAPYAPQLLRDWLAPRCYTAYLLFLGSLWLAICLFGTMSLFAAVGDFYDLFAATFPRGRLRSLRPWAIGQAALAVGFLLAATTLPPATAVIALIAVGAATFLVTPLVPHGRPKLVWRDDTNVAHAADLWIMNAAAFLRMLAIGLTLIFASAGPLVVSSAATMEGDMPITRFLGLLFAWSAVAFALVIFRLQLTVALVSRSLLRKRQSTLHIGGTGTASEARRWRKLSHRYGWQARFSKLPRELDVAIIADEASPPPDPIEAAQWPLRLRLAELEDDATRFRLQRRDEIQRRRHLVRVLSRLFKHAARHKYEEGSGFFVGLHLWYVLGLVRDEPETKTYDRYDTLLHDIIGPPYWRAFPVAVRQHFRDICEALAVDLIFVEDGVAYRRFVRVIRTMFEIYDMHGGQQQAEERHFTGVPGVRVVIHDLLPEVAPDFQQYPEPEYDDISRARVLHVFRDRGEMEAMDEIPFDFSDVPMPVGVLS